jgi:hypothetical protein
MANFSPLGDEFFNPRSSLAGSKAASSDCKTQDIPVTLGRDLTITRNSFLTTAEL